MLTSSEADGLDLSWGNEKSAMELIGKICRRRRLRRSARGRRPQCGRKARAGQELAIASRGSRSSRQTQGIKATPWVLPWQAAAATTCGPSRGSSSRGTQRRPPQVRKPRFRVQAENRGKGRVVKDFEERCALTDCLNACKNTIVNMEILDFESSADLRGCDGSRVRRRRTETAAERIVNMERVYLRELGISRADDTLPERFRKEPMPGDNPTSGSVVELDTMLDEYYDARGWDRETGTAYSETLERLGIQTAQQVHESQKYLASGSPLETNQNQ